MESSKRYDELLKSWKFYVEKCEQLHKDIAALRTENERLAKSKADWVKCAEQQGKDLRKYAADIEKLLAENGKLANKVFVLEKKVTAQKAYIKDLETELERLS